MKKLFLIITSLSPIGALAQVETSAAYVLEETNFFICLLAGVLLALGFQLLLTALSVAGGITATGNLKKKGHSSSSSSSSSKGKHHDEGMNVGQKVSTGLGVWTLITTSLALFFASLLAVKLGLIGANFIGATLGLVIWATFFMVVTYLEVNMVSSLVGGLASTVKNSLSSASSVFAKSEESIAKDVARTRAKKESKEMRKQFEKLFTTHDVDKKVEDYIQQLKPQHINIKNLKKQIKDLVMDLQVTEKVDYSDADSIKKMILEEAESSTLSKADKQAVKDHVMSLKSVAQSDASSEEKAKKGIEQLTPANKQQIEKYQQEIKKVLQNSSNKELQPEQLEADLKKVMEHPKEAPALIKSKASAMDRDTLVKIVASQNMSEQEARKRVDQAEKVLNKVSSFFGQTKDKAGSTKEGMQHQQRDLKARVQSMFSGASTDMNQIYSDFKGIFQNSGTGPDLQYKLEHYNKNEMTALITNKTSMSRAEAEPIAEKIVSARDQVVSKAREIEGKVNQKMTEAKEQALIAAEESRKAAATAAWWLVATALVSAAASAFGGMLALESFF